MQSVYVLDTSVLLHDPRAPLSFPGAIVVIPAAVVEELDAKKHNPDELGTKSRAAARLLDELRGSGRLAEGVPAPGDSIIRVELNHRAAEDLNRLFHEDTADNRILAVAYNLRKEHGGDVTLVSRDVILRIKADALGLAVTDYAEMSPGSLPESNHVDLFVEKAVIDQLYREKRVQLPNLEMAVNQFAILKDQAGGSASALARCVAPGVLQRAMIEGPVWGVAPRNVQQRMALELLMDDRVQLVTLAGRAGTGKTLLALAAGLQKVEEERTYRRLVVSRPVVPMGRDLGYLPGTQEEKLHPWMQPIYDNLEHLFGLADRERDDLKLDSIMAGMKEIVVEALTYIRGRSLPQQFLIVDEAQNLTRHEVKTVITRAGEGTKVVLVGDPDQIDHAYLDRHTNGLVYAMERFHGQPIAGHVTLVKGERSHLAQLAANLL
ncbi:MAG: PhoH family protein [Bacillota bacterium]